MEIIISGFIKSKEEVVEDISSMFNLRPNPSNPGQINVANFTATKTGNFVQISFDIAPMPSSIQSYTIPFTGGLFDSKKIFAANYTSTRSIVDGSIMSYDINPDSWLNNSQLNTGIGDSRNIKRVVFCFSVV